MQDSSLSYAILRPTVLFGVEDILINNIAWLLRRFPFFAQIGSGDYPIQPVYVDDLARLAVEAGAKDENLAWDAVGPDVFTFDGLIRLVAARIGGGDEVVKKLFDEIAPRFATRPGGYTRILKLGPRFGDSAEMVILELVEE